jgi:NADPH-dependent glutamate synthase beta subunit-like oxidoreductase
MGNIIKDVFGGANALYKGAQVTFGYMFKKRFNVQYPEDKLPLPSRFRGVLRIKDTIGSPTAALTWQQAIDVTDKEGEMPPCMQACPDHQHARDYIRFIQQRQYLLGLQISRLTMPYPGCLGRVCTRPCEDACRMGEEGESIAICQLKRFVADWAYQNVPMEQWDPVVDKVPGAERYSIGVIGGGPAGMTCAQQMARKGYRVTVYEKQPVLGGYLYTGIPQHRLPREVIDHENESVLRYGVEARLNCTVGKDMSFMDIYNRHDAVMLSTGAILPFDLGIPGEELKGVHKGEEFLEEVCLGREVKLGKRVVVVGLGLTAMDCARIARRVGGEDVKFVYRRTRDLAPAPEHEIADAEEEGIEVLELLSPIRVVGENGRVVGLEVQKMGLGERDTSGRPQPVPIEGSNYIMPVDDILTAISRTADYSYLPADLGFKFKRNKTIVVNDKLMTDVPGVFASGDGVIGAWTVIAAIGQARFASNYMVEYLKDKAPKRG